MDEDQVAHHGNVAIAGRQVQRRALVVVTVIHFHIIAAQHEVHLKRTHMLLVLSPTEGTAVAQRVW